MTTIDDKTIYLILGDTSDDELPEAPQSDTANRSAT